VERRSLVREFPASIGEAVNALATPPEKQGEGKAQSKKLIKNSN